MRRQRLVTAIALGAVATLTLSACGDNAPPAGSSGGPAAGNAAVNKTANPSAQKGGTLRYVNQDDWDSLDPADTYYGYSWNFIRLYARQLVMFKSAAGGEGATLVPDLATDLGTASPDNKTWTYHIRKGVKYEDGTEVKAQDVKYDIERTLDKDTYPNGPTYFNDFLDLQGYTSPYKDSDPKKLGLKAIDTPDDYTIVFHLKKPFAAFDYFAAIPSTAPVPPSKDTQTKYKDHVISTGPYMFDQVQPGKSFTMKRNPYYDPATAPTRPPALPDRIEVQLKVTNSNDIDQRLMSGSADVDIAGSGVQPAAQAQILRDPSLRAQTDSAITTRLWYSVINADVKPLDNIHCRKAILWAIDKTNLQRAYGGSVGGDIATNMLPPVIPGAQQFDLYPTPDHKGDVNKAKEELAACGHPNGGFSFNISYRAGRDKEEATAKAIQESLSKIGITTELHNYPTGDYLKLYAGKPSFTKANNIGIMVYGWQADWPDGFGFMAQITDSRTIHQSGGNSNLGIKDPKVDQLIDSTLNEKDAAKRNAIWVDVDKQVMSDAYVIPGVWAKGLLFRPKNLTNVFVTDGFSQYDYLALGTSNK